MRNRFVHWILTVGAVLAVSRVMLAQTPAQPGSGATKAPPDLSGIWEVVRSGDIPGLGFAKQEPPMQPWAEERYKAARKGTMEPLERGREAMDPVMHCMPHGIPRAYTAPFPIEIVQVPGRVYILFESNHQVRRIYTDGRKHPEGYPPSFMGHSIGRWNGDTLVVETIALKGNDEAWLDTAGHPQTDALRVVERIRRVDHDTLEINFLFDDPKAYTKPWMGKKVFQLRPDWEIMEQIICEEHFRQEHLPDIRRAIKE